MHISKKSSIFACSKWVNQQKIDIYMSAQENRNRLLACIANQSNKVIDYEWEVRHHREMHEAYEKSLKG